MFNCDHKFATSIAIKSVITDLPLAGRMAHFFQQVPAQQAGGLLIICADAQV